MKLGYTILHVPDVRATLAFYEAAFGLARGFVHDSGDYAELQTGQTTLAFVSRELGQSHFETPIAPLEPHLPPPGIELAFVTDDVPAAFERACRAGAQPLAKPEPKPWGQTVAYVRALEGTLIELCTPLNAA